MFGGGLRSPNAFLVKVCRHQASIRLTFVLVLTFTLVTSLSWCVYSVYRMIYTECPVTCPCADKCSNQRIQRRDWLSRSLEKFLTDDRGFGVRTTQAITSGMCCVLSLYLFSLS